ncbi:MAG: hypothetical protein HC840_00355 [Leptolyngbyaceae cyanobacterium RM2_2_4]|nr:hypothetical protein [Leptolyngbyaceae cyanobacterium RM2_2_4]
MAENQEQPSFLDKFKSPIGTLWDNHKIFLIIFGLAILIYKFREVIIDLLVSSSREAVKDAQKQDQVLRGEEKAANDQANQLRKEAEALSKEKPTVDEFWHKK